MLLVLFARCRGLEWLLCIYFSTENSQRGFQLHGLGIPVVHTFQEGPITAHQYSIPPTKRQCTSRTFTRTFTRDVILLDNCDDLMVPRGEKKNLLHRQGRIANMVDFHCGWTQRKVEEVMVGCFEGILRPSTDPAKVCRYKISFILSIVFSCNRFVFLKARGSTLQEPNVPSNFLWTGD